MSQLDEQNEHLDQAVQLSIQSSVIDSSECSEIEDSDSSSSSSFDVIGIDDENFEEHKVQVVNVN